MQDEQEICKSISMYLNADLILIVFLQTVVTLYFFFFLPILLFCGVKKKHLFEIPNSDMRGGNTKTKFMFQMWVCFSKHHVSSFDRHFMIIEMFQLLLLSNHLK